MAQTEDTELRDLVIEALEKNGSLAKIRALLRANIFLAFEEDYESIKQNLSLDKILKMPEGVLSLCLVHEFLEFCNLKNTLFVYMSESRQGKEYIYEGHNKLTEKFNLSKSDNAPEPLIVTLLKNGLGLYKKKHFDQSDNDNMNKLAENNFKDDQNCTYIVHEDSSNTTSRSNSDHSSDEKNKLHLRLQLDNSDTDTSSDSARDKTSSEYIPNDHIIRAQKDSINKIYLLGHDSEDDDNVKKTNDSKSFMRIELEQKVTHSLQDNRTTNNSSNSTSYVELKSFNAIDRKLINTPGVPLTEANNPLCNIYEQPSSHLRDLQSLVSKVDTPPSATSNSISSISSKNQKERNVDKTKSKDSPKVSGKSDAETVDYSFDFSSSDSSKKKDLQKQPPLSAENQDITLDNFSKNQTVENLHQSSQSSVSISDVADLVEDNVEIQEINSENFSPKNVSRHSTSNNSKKIYNSNENKTYSDDSGDLSESSIPSISNLSLDIHSA